MSGGSSKSGTTVGSWPAKTSPVVPSIDTESPSANVRPSTVKRRGREVDLDRRDPDHRRLAELARHQRRVAGAPAARGEDAARGEHAVHVVGLGLGAHHDDGALLVATPALGGVGVEGEHARGRARRDVEAGRDQLAARLRRLRSATGSNCGCRKKSTCSGVHALHGLGARDALLVREVDRDADRRLRGALGVARLQHPQLAALDGELDVLHVAVVLLERRAGARELLPHLRHRLRPASAMRLRRCACRRRRPRPARSSGSRPRSRSRRS